MAVDEGGAGEAGAGAPTVVLCRCEDVQGAAVERAVREFGARTLDEVKKLTRAGMGPCQGRVCAPLVRARLEAMGVDGALAGVVRPRPPLRLVPVRALAAWGARLEEPAGTVGADVLWGRSPGGATLDLDAGDGPEAAGRAPGGMGSGR